MTRGLHFIKQEAPITRCLESIEAGLSGLVLSLDTRTVPDFGICPLALQSPLLTDLSVTLAEAVGMDFRRKQIRLRKYSENEHRIGSQKRAVTQALALTGGVTLDKPLPHLSFLHPLVLQVERVKPGRL